MIENMKVEFGRTSDIDSWMRLVRKVSWNFPGLETEQSIDEHKIIVLKFMNDKRALCVKNEQEIVGVLLYSRKYNMICCLAVDPAYRKRGIASLLLREAIDKLDRDKDITVSTFRENDVKGIAPRKLYKKFGFEEGKLIEEFGYPNQRFVLHAEKSVDNVIIGNIVECAYNMDNGYVEVWYVDGNMLRIKCEEVEAALRTTEQSLAKLHKLLDNKPIEYVAIALSGEMQAYCDIEDEMVKGMFGTIVQGYLKKGYNRATAEMMAREFFRYES